MGKAATIDVFGYLDYRAFLRDVYLARKAASASFSYRAFSRRAGLKSPNYLKLVMDGERNLTAPMAARFAKALGLDDESGGYFTDLVAFNQARTSSERAAHYARLSSSTRYRKTHRLDLAQAAYYATWYVPVVRELAARSDFQDDPVWIAARTWPPITRLEAARALDVLLELGLLVRDDDGKVSQGGKALVSTGPELHAVHIANYHRTMMGRAAESIDLIPSAERDISSLTLGVGEDGVRRLKERIQRFRRELLELTLLEDDPKQVVQVNFQLFPLTREPEDA
ncbi:MAG: TIGR02147 family protein [Deltaproteobacteria bacterium]|nr:TIGR02147 family protein [Deltaproteobacteria bacterium]